MKIAGLQKLTLLDFPERIACTVFLGGCNLRCPFCHNASLADSDLLDDVIAESQLMSFLQSRVGLLDGVCFTGGEPTVHEGLSDLMRKVRKMGFAIKLDTNGTNSDALAALLHDGLVDYVAMDIKNSPARYAETCGGVDCIEAVRDSVDVLRASVVDYEFRTTLCHPLHAVEDMRQIGEWIQGAPRYFLQQFVDSGNLLGSGMAPLSAKEMKQMRDAVLPYVPNTQIRGM